MSYYFFGGIIDNNILAGVGCIIGPSQQPNFKRVNVRICKAEAKLKKNCKIFVIFVYAPTLSVSEKTTS